MTKVIKILLTLENNKAFMQMTNKGKRSSILGNYCQVLLPACYKAQFDEAELQQRKSIIKFVSKQSDTYIDLRPRDLCDVVRAVCNLLLCNLNENNKWMLKELRVLAKRAAFLLGDMDRTS